MQWIAWLLVVAGLAYWFVYASNTVALLCACGLAGLLYVLRRYARLPYGLLECWRVACYWHRQFTLAPAVGHSGSAFSVAFAQVDPRIIALQSYAGLFLIVRVRGLDNVCEGWPGGSDLVSTVWRKIPQPRKRPECMRVPIRIAIYATCLAILSPGRFLEFQERVVKPLGIPIATDNDSVNKVSGAFRTAFLVVAAAAISGSLVGLGLRCWFGRPTSLAVIPWLQVGSALILLLSTVYVRSDIIRTYDGATLIERVDRWIYCTGYFIGTAAIVTSLVWPL